MSKHDLKAMEPYKSGICAAGRETGLPPSLIAGVMSRESNGGRALDKNGYGDHGNGYGLMQVDKRHHKVQGAPRSDENIAQGANILKSSIKAVERAHPTWNAQDQLRGEVAAYNFEVKNVRTVEEIDRGTTGNNCLSDVMKWADFFRENGYHDGCK